MAKTYGQANTDSLAATDNQKKITALQETIMQQKDQLTQLESKYDELKQNAEKKTNAAQQSAEANKQAASTLALMQTTEKKQDALKKVPTKHQAMQKI